VSPFPSIKRDDDGAEKLKLLFRLFLLSPRQDELYVVQEEEKLLSVAQYDLGLRPKLKKSDKMKSLSMPNVHAVKPVESSAGSGKTAIQVKAFDSPKAPIKKKDVQINTIKRIEDIMISKRLQRMDAQGIGRKKVRIKTLPIPLV
jgi:hypothetical protein